MPVVGRTASTHTKSASKIESGLSKKRRSCVRLLMAYVAFGRMQRG